MLNEVIITEKANQLLAELRENPDWAIDEKISNKVISKPWSGFYEILEL